MSAAPTFLLTSTPPIHCCCLQVPNSLARPFGNDSGRGWPVIFRRKESAVVCVKKRKEEKENLVNLPSGSVMSSWVGFPLPSVIDSSWLNRCVCVRSSYFSKGLASRIENVKKKGRILWTKMGSKGGPSAIASEPLYYNKRRRIGPFVSSWIHISLRGPCLRSLGR